MYTFYILQISSRWPLGVVYFRRATQKKSEKRWTADEHSFKIIQSDILRILQEPTIGMIGSRLYYAFKYL